MVKDIKKECAKKIRDLLPNIAGVDKTDACYELKLSRPTLDKYLDGHISKVDTAIRIIEFFSARIADKVARLQGAA